MSSFRVYLTCTAVHYVDVDAETQAAAEEKALDMAGKSSDVRLSSENDWTVMEVHKK